MAGKDEIRAALDAANSREEARGYIDSLGLTKAELKAVGSALGVPVSYTARTKGEISDRIVNGTTGARLTAAAFRNVDLRPKLLHHATCLAEPELEADHEVEF